MPLDPPNLPSVSRIVGHWSTDVGGANAISVWHVLSNGIAALEVFNRFSTAWDVNQLSVTTAHARLHTLDVTRLDLQSATESFTTVGTEWAGGVVGEYSPATAVLVKYSTGFRGLASVGHTFVPFVAEEAMENGQVLPAALPALATAWVTFVNTLTTQTIPLQVVSYGRADHATLPDAPATNHTVTACTVSGILATQRNRQSRLRG
jgi:hypothetical protein